MLRFLVLLLLLANGAFFAWSQGYLASIGFAPAHQTEPQRLQAQIKPDAMRLLSSTEAKRVEALATTPAPRAPECLQSMLLTEAQVNAIRSVAVNLPSNSWSLDSATEPARWIVYMGKYANAEALAKKKTELRELSIAFESLKNSTLEPGVSLGVYATQAQANESMAKLATRGVRTAKVVQELPERKGQLLKLPIVDDALRAQLDGIKSVVGAAGLVVCKAV
ncbi:SPOR domain-containing protein [Variovorax sp. PCZ-1]|uniref:SPOR domain-containing protein n=1 Tax=Variovorax sp. PCZ-1 TaxID=2835533 RepID=UPI001BCF4B25|nr:SPOR domain-containing protein [Variovorax sp. PCZ-1]MBS7806584.1 SPOR domain-containing protein [Variovorax sp. PCZ-1]